MFHGVINGIILDVLKRIREEILELFEEMSLVKKSGILAGIHVKIPEKNPLQN